MLEAETIMKREFEATLLRYKPLLKAVSNVKSGMYCFYVSFALFSIFVHAFGAVVAV